jgi:septum site-determining protein MinD
MAFGNIHLLCAPLQPERTLTDDMLLNLLVNCTEYDAVLIDAPAGIGFGFRTALLAANRCLIVSTADPICVRSVAVAARQAQRFGCNDVHLIINRFDRALALQHKLLMIDDVIDRTETQLIGVIPQQTRLFAQTSDGQPLQANLVTAAAARIAARLDGENLPLDIPASV